MNIDLLMAFDRAVMIYKIVNQLSPKGLQKKFIERSLISKFDTRKKKDLHMHKLASEHTK